jgi:hypothetical protein
MAPGLFERQRRLRRVERGVMLVIDWYHVPHRTQLATVRRSELVASAKVTFHKVGKAKVKIKLTAKGRRLLKRAAKHLRLTAKGSFTPVGEGTTTATKAITV